MSIPTIIDILPFMSRINCWHFNIHEQDKFHAQLSFYSHEENNLDIHKTAPSDSFQIYSAVTNNNVLVR